MKPPPMKPGPTIDPTDILAIVLMAIFSMRRMDVRATDFRAFPHLVREAFDGWKARALGAKDLQVNACFAKFAINSVWFFGFRNRVAPRLLMAVGALLFFGWIAALLWGGGAPRMHRERHERLGIVLGRRLVPARFRSTRTAARVY